MTLSTHRDGQEKWRLCTDLYVVPADGSPVFFPSHLWNAEFLHVYTGEKLPIDMRPKKIEETANGSASPEQIKCVGPMHFTMSGEKVIPFVTRALPSEIEARICLGMAGVDNLAVVLDLRMTGPKRQEDGSFTWEQGNYERPKTVVGAF
jgi:hypothetical protein